MIYKGKLLCNPVYIANFDYVELQIELEDKTVKKFKALGRLAVACNEILCKGNSVRIEDDDCGVVKVVTFI